MLRGCVSFLHVHRVQLSSGRSSLTSRRGLTVKRRRRFRKLDEYDQYDAPLRLKVWRKVQEQKSFYAYAFEDMTAPEVAETIYLAVKLEITSEPFWERARLAIGDVATAFSPKQLATACWALGASKWGDVATANALAPAIGKAAKDFRYADLAIVIQSFARSQVFHAPILRALARAAQDDQRFNAKGLITITTAFATLHFRSDGFLQRLDTWATQGGVNRCSEEQVADLVQALTSLIPAQPGVGVDDRIGNSSGGSVVGGAIGTPLIEALGRRVAESADVFEPPELLTLTLSFSKLAASDAELVNSLEKALGEELHRLPVKSLPAVLDAFTALYVASGPSQAQLGPQRKRFVSLLTGRLTRELRHLRPQDACRSIQALDRLGVIDPNLLAASASLVPRQLAVWPATWLLGMLEAYATAGNRDGFMATCLRRALLPVVAGPRIVGTGGGGPVDAAMLDQLDDVEVVRAALAFSTISHSAGFLLLLVVLGGPRTSVPPPCRSLARCCEIALVFTAEQLLQSQSAWNTAVDTLIKAEHAAAQHLVQAVDDTTRKAWLKSTKVTSEDADDLALAVCAFPGHPALAVWTKELLSFVESCSIAVLPGLLLASGIRDSAELQQLASQALLSRLAAGEGRDLPAAAVVAAARALTLRPHAHNAEQAAGCAEVVLQLAQQLVTLAECGQASCKALVRMLQVLQALGLEPPAALLGQLASLSAQLTPTELLLVLRILPTRCLQSSKTGDMLSAMATRSLSRLRSSRQAWELQALCERLGLELGEVEAVTVEDDPGVEEQLKSPLEPGAHSATDRPEA